MACRTDWRTPLPLLWVLAFRIPNHIYCLRGLYRRQALSTSRFLGSRFAHFQKCPYLSHHTLLLCLGRHDSKKRSRCGIVLILRCPKSKVLPLAHHVSPISISVRKKKVYKFKKLTKSTPIVLKKFSLKELSA